MSEAVYSLNELRRRENQLARASMQVDILAADEDGEKGTIDAIVSAYNVTYRMGLFEHHTIEPGAFAESIAAQDAIPLFWMHAWDWTEQPPIGHGTASEVTRPRPGLRIAGEMYLDQPGVAPVFRALKAGALREWSIGYRINEFRVEDDDESNRIITKAELLEASSVLRGANPETMTLQVASANPAALRRLADSLGLAADELRRLMVGVTEATAVPSHGTSTVDRPWDAGTHVGRLPSPMSLATARAMYARYDGARVENGQIVKDACSLPHHEVSTDGRPGAANLPGVRNALSRLPQSDIPTSEHAAIRAHLQAHLDDAPEDEGADPDAETTGAGEPEVDDLADARREIADARNRRRLELIAP